MRDVWFGVKFHLTNPFLLFHTFETIFRLTHHVLSNLLLTLILRLCFSTRFLCILVLGSYTKTELSNQSQQEVWNKVMCVTLYTPETVYKVPISPRGNLLNKQIYLTTDPKMALQWYIGALKWLLYKWFYFISGYFIIGLWCISKTQLVFP